MSQPKWITPAGNLGIVPELEYYEFPLLVTDDAAGTIRYDIISGKLPLGIQLVHTGKLTGIPVSELGGDRNVKYTFSIRATNTSTLSVVDRTFYLTITNVAPPQISPKGENTVLVLAGNIIRANVGDTITQLNGTSLSLSDTVTVTAGGQLYQPGTGATANIAVSTVNSSNVTVLPPTGVFSTVGGNLYYNSVDLGVYPTLISTLPFAKAIVVQNTSGVSGLIPISYQDTNSFIFNPNIASGLGYLIKNGTVTSAYPISTQISVYYLGFFSDGLPIDIQLSAIEFTPGATVTWTVKSGDLPPGLSLTTDGLLTGYIKPIPSNVAGTTPGWDNTAWSYLGWDFPIKSITKTFTFTVEAFDGVNADLATYTMQVFPRAGITADDDQIRVNDILAENQVALTADIGGKHNPIITTAQSTVANVRQNTYVAVNFDAIDIDGDVLQYSIPSIDLGTFDEQVFSTSKFSYPYVAYNPSTNGNLTVGVFPNIAIAGNSTVATISLYTGNVLTANVGYTITQPSSGAAAVVTANITNSKTIPVTITSGSFTTSKGNLLIKDNTGRVVISESAVSDSANISGVELTVGGSILGAFEIGTVISGNGITSGTTIIALGSGNGQAGTYTVNYSQSVGSVAITGVTRGVVPDIVAVGGITLTKDYTAPYLVTGNQVKVLQKDNVGGQFYDLWHLATVTNASKITLTGNNKPTLNSGDVLTQAVSSTTASITNVSVTTGFINVGGTTQTGNITIFGSLPTYIIYFGNIISANVGDFITQAVSSANATVVSNVIPVTTSTINTYGGIGTNTMSIPSLCSILGIGTKQLVVGSGLPANTYVNSTSANSISLSKSFISAASGEYTFYAANALVVTYNTANKFTQYTTPAHSTTGNLKINGGTTTTYYPSSNVTQINRVTVQANIGDVITQASTGANAIVTASVADAVTIPVIFNYPTAFATGSGNIRINAVSVAAYPTAVNKTSALTTVSVSAGDVITQAGSAATATVTKDSFNSFSIPVSFTSGNFTLGSGNIKVNASSLRAYPSSLTCNTNVNINYNTNVFKFNEADTAGNVLVNGAPIHSYPSSVLEVGITVSPSVYGEGVVGFDEGKFDQGTLNLPQGLSMDLNTGWLTGHLPPQTIQEKTYNFELTVYKRDFSFYQAKKLYSLTVLGDLNNRIDWITTSDLGSLENGKISDVFVKANSTKGKTLYYSLKLGGANRLPQGLALTTSGLLSGRVSFEMFSLDKGTTTMDPTALGLDGTTFDDKYTFTVTASDFENTIAADRTFTIKIIQANKTPYENLYLKALTTEEQRLKFQDVLLNKNLFPPQLIYRNDDPFFGLASDVRTLFLAGLKPSTLAAYTKAAGVNHYTKRLTFGNIKTAVVLDDQFNTKYEVVYITIGDENTVSNSAGYFGPPDNIDLSGKITTPYYDAAGNSYTVAYPNSFENMTSAMSSLGYANKGALPDWMTSDQIDPADPTRHLAPLGFTRAVVLAYTVPGASNLIKYRLEQNGFNFNDLDFEVDRYQLDNIYSANYNIPQDAVRLSDVITANTGSIITQASSGATALVLDTVTGSKNVVIEYISGSFRSYDLANVLYTTLHLSSNITANAGTYITQSISGTNVQVLESVVNSNTVDVFYLYSSFTLFTGTDHATSGNISVNGLQTTAYPTNTISLNDPTLGNIAVDGIDANVYPVSTYTTISTDSYVISDETTFDRYPALSTTFTTVGTVDYAVSTSYEDLNNCPLDYIIERGGLDGVATFKDGDTLVFAQQEFRLNSADIGSYNQGWSNVQTLWDNVSWAYNSDTTDDDNTDPGTDLTPGLAWDKADYIPGYNEHLIDPTVNNERIGIWRVNIDINEIVTLTYVQSLSFYNVLYVRNGAIYGRTNIYFDPVVKPGLTIPNYSIIPQQIRTNYTKFDGNGTRFYDHRDSYSVPESGDKYIKFAKNGVFI